MTPDLMSASDGRGYVAQRLDTAVAKGDCIQASGLVHDNQTQCFHQMILQHVLQCAGPIVVVGAPFQRQTFKPTDVNLLHMLGIEDRFKDLVGKA